MRKIHKYFCIPFIIICIASIMYICYLSCLPLSLRVSNSILTVFPVFIIILIGIFTDSTYLIREKISKVRKNEQIIK